MAAIEAAKFREETSKKARQCLAQDRYSAAGRSRLIYFVQRSIAARHDPEQRGGIPDTGYGIGRARKQQGRQQFLKELDPKPYRPRLRFRFSCSTGRSSAWRCA